MPLLKLFKFTKKVLINWQNDNVPNLSAALSYYAIFSLAPILIVCIDLIGYFFNKEALQTHLLDQINNVMGEQISRQIEFLMNRATLTYFSNVPEIIGILILLIGSIGFFSALQNGLNTIWKVKEKPGNSILNLIRQKFLSFLLVLVIAGLLLFSFVMSAFISFLSPYLNEIVYGGFSLVMMVNLFISISIITILCAMIFKILPDHVVKWSDVWLGAFVTSILFTIGKVLIGVYLTKSNIISQYGAAGSLLMILIWVYYSANIFFLGAEFTKVYAGIKHH